MNKKQVGFTLIELLIVIAIIGILAMVAFPSYRHYLLKSEATMGVAEIAAGKGSYTAAVSQGETVSQATAIGLQASTSVCTITPIANNGGLQCEYKNETIGGGSTANVQLQYSAGQFTCVTSNMDSEIKPNGCE